MNNQEEINELQSKINQLKNNISNCKHDWTEAKYDPETVKEGYGYKQVAQGSDVWGEYEGYRDVKKSRWSRKCKVCGHIQYTDKQEIVEVKKQPKF
ncbi:MAG TPA: hypothetical protein VNX68_15680 [Nitrosopumilaceae archaeon]|jgi:hypothetical protein|nr:hypothetical protein [Nitrosopumilaceae archaeon]